MVGELVGDRIVFKGREANRLESKFYGVRDGELLYLSLVEAAYLLYKKKISIFLDNKNIEYDTFIKIASKRSERFLMKFYAYRDLRDRGYIVKTALKYGADFRVYDRGTFPGKEHSKWILFVVGEDEKFLWQKFASMVRVAHSVRKNLLIGIVDSEGDVTYYEVSWIKL